MFQTTGTIPLGLYHNQNRRKRMGFNQGRMPRVDASHFSMVPSADVPRSTFVTTHSYKSTFDFDYLVPIYVDEVIPGDVHRGNLTIFARLNNLLFPLMDRVTLDTFFFFVPNRLVWTNWRKMMGEQDNPGDSISYITPWHTMPAGGFTVGSLQDYMGLPTVGQVLGGGTGNFNALPMRAYALIYNQWFRDENLQNPTALSTGDGPDANPGNPMLLKRAKRHDYFTSCLPWPLKGGTEVTTPLQGSVPVTGIGLVSGQPQGASAPNVWENGSPGGVVNYPFATVTSAAGGMAVKVQQNAVGSGTNLPQVFANLSAGGQITINAIRLSFATQAILERDARGGTRYTELLRSHFGVTPEDARLQRPEYIGGGSSDFQTSAIPQTSATGLTGGSTPAGSLTAQATCADTHSFSYHATEHGFILGIVNVRAELTYQQGVHKMWKRLGRYDYYWPAFAYLGEQAVLNQEIYYDSSANDVAVFGYQERWAEYRHRPSRITGLFKSRSAGNIDEWHLAQDFAALPALNASFIGLLTPTSRVLAAGAAANGQQILFDSVFRVSSTRPMPTFSVPAQLGRF